MAFLIRVVPGSGYDALPILFAYCKLHNLTRLLIETNGIGAFLPRLMRKVTAGSGIAVIGKHTTQNKNTKIREAYEVRLAAERLHVHKSVAQSKFMHQFRDFNPKRTQKDDFIDAPAAAILNEPIRIRNTTTQEQRILGIGRQSGPMEIGRSFGR